MSEIAVEAAGLPSTNGGPDPLGLDPKATVLAREDFLSGKLVVKGTGQVLGNFSGQIESDGDILIGPEAHVEADIRGARITLAGLVRGNVIATSRLKITSSGRLEGDATVGALAESTTASSGCTPRGCPKRPTSGHRSRPSPSSYR